MRRLLATLVIALAAAAVVPARDVPEERRPARRSTDPEYRDRLQLYLTAYHHLSPEMRQRVRQLDKDIQEEDPATRSRLLGVLQRYAYWLSRIPEADRKRIASVPAGPGRLQVVREALEQQWLDGLPPVRKDQLAKASVQERVRLIETWHKEEQGRLQDRAWAIKQAQELANPDQAQKRKQFREAVERFVKTELEAKLTAKEKASLQRTVTNRGTGSFAYMHQVWVLSQTHKLIPPGSPEVWAPFKEPRRP